MKKTITTLLTIVGLMSLTGCQFESTASATKKEAHAVERQQAQYEKSQPIPTFNWSLERDLVIKLYKLRNQKVSTHSVWRSKTGMIEGDCPSIGFGIPYDVSLTNPWVSVDRANNGKRGDGTDYSLTSVGQPEPNGIFASQNTNATWIMCVGDGGTIEPHYVEATVNVYPYDVKVDYKNNRVTRVGKKSVQLK